MEYRAHENGRQSVRRKSVGIFAVFVLSPAFAGFKFFLIHIDPGFRSQSSLHPRLYAYACSAG
jgi:hypothetical protein